MLGVICVSICTQTLQGWSRKLLMQVPISWEAEIEGTACGMASGNLAGMLHLPVVRRMAGLLNRMYILNIGYIDVREGVRQEGWLPLRIQFIDCNKYTLWHQTEESAFSSFPSTNTTCVHATPGYLGIYSWFVYLDSVHVHTWYIRQC